MSEINEYKKMGRKRYDPIQNQWINKRKVLVNRKGMERTERIEQIEKHEEANMSELSCIPGRQRHHGCVPN